MTDFGPQLPEFAEIATGVRRLLAPNPSMMTGPGTNTYLIGKTEVAVLDPGPSIAAHIDRIQAVAAAPIRYILVTHTHPDHSPAAARLAQLTGAELLGRPPPEGAHQDVTFKPARILEDGDRIEVDGVDIEVIHTPGHASNHVCYRHSTLNWIFTGDHVIDGSTVVIDPPDGSMKQYLESLAKVRDLDPLALAPGHGEVIEDPKRAINWIIDHRLDREAKVLAALRQNSGLTSMQLVPHVYKDVDRKLYGWAERSLLAHLLKLEIDRVAERREDCWFTA